MANTIAYGENSVDITFDGSTAWNPGTVYRVVSFEFIPGGDAKTVTVRGEGSATGPVEFYALSAAADGVADQRKSIEHGYEGNGRNITPYVVGNEASASSRLIMKFV
jgi:hypothetical protein